MLNLGDTVTQDRINVNLSALVRTMVETQRRCADMAEYVAGKSDSDLLAMPGGKWTQDDIDLLRSVCGEMTSLVAVDTTFSRRILGPGR